MSDQPTVLVPHQSAPTTESIELLVVALRNDVARLHSNTDFILADFEKFFATLEGLKAATGQANQLGEMQLLADRLVTIENTLASNRVRLRSHEKRQAWLLLTQWTITAVAAMLVWGLFIFKEQLGDLIDQQRPPVAHTVETSQDARPIAAQP